MNKWTKIFSLALLSISFSQAFAQQYQVNERGYVLKDGHNTGYRYNEQGQVQKFRYPTGGDTNYWRSATPEESQRMQGNFEQGYDNYSQGNG